MQNTVAPILNSAVSRLAAGFVNGVSDHPYATCALLAMLAVTVGLLLLDPADEGRGEWMDGE